MKVKGADLYDFKSSNELVKMFGIHTRVDKVLIAEEIKSGDKTNFCNTDIARILIRIKKD